MSDEHSRTRRVVLSLYSLLAPLLVILITGSARASAAPLQERSDSWELWWRDNRDLYLPLYTRRAVPRASRFLVGHGSIEPGWYPPSVERLKGEVLPALLAGLAGQEPEVASACAFAIGQSLRPEHDPRVLVELRRALGHGDESVRESATLALGAMRARECVPVLLDLLGDTAQGRVVSGRPSGIGTRTRAFAAASLGLIGDATAIEPLIEVVERTGTPADVQELAMLALGLMTEQHETIVAVLRRAMRRSDLAPRSRSQAAIALGRLRTASGEREVPRLALGDCAELLGGSDTPDQLARSLTICVGQLARPGDASSVDALWRIAGQGSGSAAHHLALLSLAQIAARDEDPSAHEPFHQRLDELLMRKLSDIRSPPLQSYAALALAIAATNGKLEAARTRAARRIADMLQRCRDVSLAGALATALGVIGDRDAAGALRERFEASDDLRIRGYVAVALGMLEDTELSDRFRELAVTTELPHGIRVQLATALALLRDEAAVGALIDSLQAAGSLSEFATASAALSTLGERNAVFRLCDALEHGRTPHVCELAAVALGELCWRGDRPWNAPFSTHGNHRARCDALVEILDID